MTFSIIGAFLGAILGVYRARKANGNRNDILQYGAVFAIIGALVGMIAAIILVRSV